MERSKEESNREETLLGYWKLCNMPFGRESVLQKVASLRFLQRFDVSFPTSNLNRINPVLLFCLDLGHLAPIYLEYGTEGNPAPSIPVVGAPHFVGQQTDSL